MRSFYALALINLLVGTTSGQESGAMVVNGLTSAFKTLMSSDSGLTMIMDIARNPGAALAGGNASSQVLGMLQKVRATTQEVGAECLQHLGVFVTAVGQKQEWALRMIDAIGKPPSGLLNLKLNWIGDWDECNTAQAVVYENITLKSRPTYPFTGKYCPVSVPLPFPPLAPGQGPPALVIGACFPETCSGADLTAVMKLLVSIMPDNSSIPEPQVSCQEKKIELDTQAIIVTVVCFIFVTVMLLATLYDVVYVNWLAKSSRERSMKYQNGIDMEGGVKKTDVFTLGNGSLKHSPDEKPSNGEMHAVTEVTKTNQPQMKTDEKYKPSALESILLSFSVFTNGSKILNTHQPKGALTAVNGIRFISMTWVIVGHGFGWIAGPAADNYVTYFTSLAKRKEFEPIANGTFSVDTFFLLSGLLVSYLSLKELKKVNGARGFKWGMFYFHRFWRLTPPYLLLLLLHVSLDKYLANGPLWPQDGFEREECSKSWWTNALYINNLVTPGKALGCFGWTWYLANDMQFYIISPLVLIPLFYLPILGSLACLALLLGSAVSSGLISMYYELPSSTLYAAEKGDAYMWYYYVKPWCRVGPYAVGLFTGYVLYRSQLKAKINKVLNVILWLVAIVLGAVIIYSPYSPDFKDPFTLKQAALYNATSRSVWGGCVAWVIYSCANGFGGPINHLLSWSAFVPLGRLTYFAYLVHPMIMSIQRVTMLSSSSVFDYSMIYLILGHLCMSYGMAFVLSLAFEAPMMALEKVLLGRGKKKN